MRRRKISNQITAPVITAAAVVLLILIVVSAVLVKRLSVNQLQVESLNAEHTFFSNLDLLINKALQLVALLPENANTQKAYYLYYKAGDLEQSIGLLQHEFANVKNRLSQTDYSNLRIH